MVTRTSISCALSLAATLVLGACGSRSDHPEVPIGYTLATDYDTEEARGAGGAPKRRQSPVVSAAVSPEGLGASADAETDGADDENAVESGEEGEASGTHETVDEEGGEIGEDEELAGVGDLDTD